MRKQAVWICSLVLLLAPFAAAQDAARNAYDKLVENFVAAKLARSEQSARIQQSDAYKDAVAAGDYTASQALLANLPNPEATFKPKFEAACERFAESPDEALFLGWLLENVRPPRGKASDYAVQLVERHAKHEIWKTLVPNAPYYFGSDPAPQLAKLSAESPFDEVQTWLRYANTQSVLRSKQSSDEAKAAAKAEQESILREQPDSIPALQIAGPEFKKSRLQIGMVAPEIEGPDLDGQTFKLSDYRGKVVVLDFWGDW
jgi:hypothetical protein